VTAQIALHFKVPGNWNSTDKVKQLEQFKDWLWLGHVQQMLCYDTAIAYLRRLKSHPTALTHGALVRHTATQEWEEECDRECFAALAPGMDEDVIGFSLPFTCASALLSNARTPCTLHGPHHAGVQPPSLTSTPCMKATGRQTHDPPVDPGLASSGVHST